MNYIVNLCGPSKDYFSQNKVTVESDLIMNPIELKNHLLSEIGSSINKQEAKSILDSCLVATEQNILSNDAPIPDGCNLFLLPPVCGG